MSYITGIWSMGVMLLTMQIMISIYDSSGFSGSIMFHCATLITGFIFGMCIQYWVSK